MNELFPLTLSYLPNYTALGSVNVSAARWEVCGRRGGRTSQYRRSGKRRRAAPLG
ncbi:hypothetical protein [Deinococcus sp.]|uniref:hypothetical protein n=1 Tax=Deinococcus sp. TaxID=47478 RepID=UPI003C7AF457